jgi:hypothetical protein
MLVRGITSGGAALCAMVAGSSWSRCRKISCHVCSSVMDGNGTPVSARTWFGESRSTAAAGSTVMLPGKVRPSRVAPRVETCTQMGRPFRTCCSIVTPKHVYYNWVSGPVLVGANILTFVVSFV